jgi:SAM-dependent methyltransferase
VAETTDLDAAAKRRSKMHGVLLTSGCVLVVAMLALTALLRNQSSDLPTRVQPEPRERLDTPFIVTPPHIVDQMIALAELQEDDLVYDLGCGDGRILIAAAQQAGCHAVGFDIDADLVRQARENAKSAGVEHLVTVQQRDVLTVDLSEASVVMVYLLPWIMEKLIPQFDAMEPGSRIVSHDFRIAGCEPDKTIETTAGGPNGDLRFVHLWITPLKKGTAPK